MRDSIRWEGLGKRVKVRREPLCTLAEFAETVGQSPNQVRTAMALDARLKLDVPRSPFDKRNSSCHINYYRPSELRAWWAKRSKVAA